MAEAGPLCEMTARAIPTNLYIAESYASEAD